MPIHSIHHVKQQAWTTQLEDFEMIAHPLERTISIAEVIMAEGTVDYNETTQKPSEQGFVHIFHPTRPQETMPKAVPVEIKAMIAAQTQVYTDMKHKQRVLEDKLTHAQWKQCILELSAKQNSDLAEINKPIISKGLSSDLHEQLEVYRQLAPSILTEIFAKSYGDSSFVPDADKTLPLFEIMSRMFIRRYGGVDAQRWKMARRWHDTFEAPTLWAIAEVDAIFDFFYEQR